MLAHLQIEIARIVLGHECILDLDVARQVPDDATYLELLDEHYEALREYHGENWFGAVCPGPGDAAYGDGDWELAHTTCTGRTRLGLRGGRFDVERLAHTVLDFETYEDRAMGPAPLEPASARDCLLACMVQLQGAAARRRALFELAWQFGEELDVIELAREVLVDPSDGVDADLEVLELVEEARASWEERWTAWSRAHSDLAIENAANAGETLVWEDAPRRGDARAAALEQLELPTALELGVTARERHHELLEELVDERGSWRL